MPCPTHALPLPCPCPCLALPLPRCALSAWSAIRFGSEEMFNFTSYPSLFVFKDGKMDHPYWGGREVEDMVFYMAAVARGEDPEEEERRRRPGLVHTSPGHIPARLPAYLPGNVHCQRKNPTRATPHPSPPLGDLRAVQGKDRQGA